TLPDIFSETLDIRTLVLEGTLIERLERLVIDRMVAETAGPVFIVSGSVEGLSRDPEKFNPKLDLAIGVEKLTLENLRRYWPLPLAPETTRPYVIDLLEQGRIPKAEATLRFDLASLRDKTAPHDA